MHKHFNKFRVAFGTFVACCGLNQVSFANVALDLGYGSRISGLSNAGSGVASWSAFATYYNPSALAFNHQQRRFNIDYGFVFAKPSFLPIDNVVVENNTTSDKSPPRYDSINTTYPNTTGQVFGATWRLFPEWKYNPTLGINAFMPLEYTTFIDTGDEFAPEYVMYRARTQRLQIDAGAGMHVFEWMSLGAGVHIGLTLNSTANVYLQSKSGHPSTMRFASQVQPKAAPYFGLMLQGPENTWISPFSFGAVYRLPLKNSNSMVLRSSARAIGDLVALDFNFGASSTLYFDPAALELAFSVKEGRWARTYTQLEWQFWSAFEAPALLIGNVTTGQGITISPSNALGLSAQNILVPRLGQEVYIGPVTARVGFAYKPSIFAGLPTGTGNYLDPAKWTVSLGGGYRGDKFLFLFDVPYEVDAHFAFHYLVHDHVDKAPGDDNGSTTTGDLRIGAPGYSTGGSVYALGLSLRFEL